MVEREEKERQAEKQAHCRITSCHALETITTYGGAMTGVRDSKDFGAPGLHANRDRRDGGSWDIYFLGALQNLLLRCNSLSMRLGASAPEG